ncbi:MAG: thiamine-phosphate kinase [Phycisphaerae bacterium]|nr:thiamine-phosphate kinase [Phycisphaerae bacterium]
MKEASFIAYLRSLSVFDPAVVPVGPGDDMAVVRCGGQDLLVAADQVLDGVHFRLAEHGARAAGRKAMARNLSDVAAMAGEPLAAVATVALPVGFSESDAKEMYAGLRELGDAFGCPLVGGDVGSWGAALAISLTILARPGAGGVVLRSGARVGDAICVTGELGAAWQTTRHLTFTPRVAEARILAERYRPHAMIDLSDGLSVDLGHVCEASGVGADVCAPAVPVHPDARKRPDPLAAALGDGEDYELLFTLPPAEADRLIADGPLEGVAVTRIGTIVAGAARTLVLADGRRVELTATGWRHDT